MAVNIQANIIKKYYNICLKNSPFIHFFVTALGLIEKYNNTMTIEKGTIILILHLDIKDILTPFPFFCFGFFITLYAIVKSLITRTKTNMTMSI